MNAQLKTILLTVLTLSCFVIALVELSGVSSTALFNKFHVGGGGSAKEMSFKEEDQRAQRASTMLKTTMAFTETKHSFGNIKEGEIVKHSFHFRNTGTAPLFIVKADASCGCTVPSIPKEPIAPGGEGDIVVQFDSHNRKGHQMKNVLVTSNATPEKVSIGFEADVQ